jgi:hypothetical protein
VLFLSLFLGWYANRKVERHPVFDVPAPRRGARRTDFLRVLFLHYFFMTQVKFDEVSVSLDVSRTLPSFILRGIATAVQRILSLKILTKD